MARIRSLKIGFFTNEDLCSLSTWHRLLFEGLWLIADREGRLEDRPLRIKAAIFPYDSVKIERLLPDLVRLGFVVSYQVDGVWYLAIRNWLKHQRPRDDEADSVLPPPPDNIDTNQYRHSDGTVTAQCIGNIGDLGSGVRDLGSGNLNIASACRGRFERWWTEYPRKVGKDAAWREWLKRSPSDDLTDRMIATLHEQRASAQWLKDGGQFIPHPRTYLHQGRWEDEPEPPPTALERAGVRRPALPPRTQTNLASAAAFMANHAGKDVPS